MYKEIGKVDPEVARLIDSENRRLSGTLEMIASENIASRAVMTAAGSALTNKYAEGYPGRRYYGGCRYVDRIEELAISRAKKLFGAGYVNVQPHSVTQANMGVLVSVLKPGDRLLGMSLDCGGHLSHGSKYNFSGFYYQSFSYGVDRDTELIDYEEVARRAREVRPKMIICGASAYPRKIDFARFRGIADEVGALLLADIAHIAGPVIAGLHPDPVPHAHFTTSTTHKTLRGPRGGIILSDAGRGKALDRSIFPGIQGGPLMHIVAAKAVAFAEALQPDFPAYQAKILSNCRVLGEKLLERGFRLVTGGTDNHLLLVDLSGRGVTGAQAEETLEKVGLSTNKNMIPFDRRNPRETSGLRLGTPAVTTRGMGNDEMGILAEVISEALDNRDNPGVLRKLRSRISELCRIFPIYTPKKKAIQ